MSDFDVEIQKVMEENTANNLQAVVDHANETRKRVHELEEEITGFKLLIAQQHREFDNLRAQIVYLLNQQMGSGPTE